MGGVLVLLLASMSSCTSAELHADDQLRLKLVDAVHRASDGAIVDLAATLDANWDRVALLPPYTSNEEARKALGVAFNAQASPTYVDDNGTVIVLARGDSVVAWFPMYWRDADLGCLTTPLTLAVTDARFVVGTDANGFHVLKPANDPAACS